MIERRNVIKSFFVSLFCPKKEIIDSIRSRGPIDTINLSEIQPMTAKLSTRSFEVDEKLISKIVKETLKNTGYLKDNKRFIEDKDLIEQQYEYRM